MTKKELVINFILERINSRKFRPGDKVFSASQLSEFCHVSQITAINALKELVSQNILEARQGSGTYVKEKFQKGKKILIVGNEDHYFYQIGNHYRLLMTYLKEKIFSLGFEPVEFLVKNSKIFHYSLTENQIEESLLEDVAGAFSLTSSNEITKQIISKNIPVISIENSKSICPGVFFNNATFFKTIFRLTDSYFSGNVCIFSSYSLFDHNKITPFEYVDKFQLDWTGFTELLTKKWTVFQPPISNKNMIITKYIENCFKTFSKPIDGIVFTDDTIYNNTVPLFNKYDSIFKNAKIITHSNNDEYYPKNYRICRLVYKIENFANPAINMLIKLINGEKLLETNIYVDCEVINEELIK